MTQDAKRQGQFQRKHSENQQGDDRERESDILLHNLPGALAQSDRVMQALQSVAH